MRTVILILVLLAAVFLSTGSDALAGEGSPPVARVAVLAWRDSISGTLIREGLRGGLLRTRIPVSVEAGTCGESERKALERLASWRAKEMDLYVGIGPEAALFLRREVKDRPVVFASVRDPVLSGILDELHPRRRGVTGAYLDLDEMRVLNLFRAMHPGLRRLGVLYSAGARGPEADVLSVEASLEALPEEKKIPLSLVRAPVDRRGGPQALFSALEALLREDVQAVWLPEDPFVLAHLQALAGTASASGVPLLGTHPEGVRRHTMVGISPDYAALGVRTAALCARILRDGKPAGTLPLGVVRTFHVVVNLRAAGRAGVRIPLIALTRADVIVDRDGW